MRLVLIIGGGVAAWLLWKDHLKRQLAGPPSWHIPGSTEFAALPPAEQMLDVAEPWLVNLQDDYMQ